MEYEEYERMQENEPTDDELLDMLDAYGFMEYTVGGGEEGETYSTANGDWLACLDYHSYVTADGDLKVAYHVVVNSESGCFIDTVESGVLVNDEVSWLIDLPMRYFAIAQDMAVASLCDTYSAVGANSRWNQRMQEIIEKIS